MLNALLGRFSSFRAQMVLFVAGMLVLTTIALYLINARSEKRIAQQVDDYVQATTRATEIALRSLSEGTYLYDLVDPMKGGTLPVNAESIINHILVVDSQTREIFDSTNRLEIKQRLDPAITELPVWQVGDTTFNAGGRADERESTIRFTFETEKAKRTVIIVVSKKRFNRVIETAARDRLIAIGLLGLLQVVLIYTLSKGLTQPFTELSRAAHQVTEGNLDFEVHPAGPKEVSTLSTTFNEMLVGLRRSRDLEDQLQRAERSAVVGRLASGIAHEIRNPLNFINLSIDHLRASFAPKEEPARRQYDHILRTIKDELARLNRLVSDFLSYGRPAKLKLRELDARALIEEVRSLVAAQADEQGVRISIEQKGDGPTTITADAELIKTCFSNLMINAVQAMAGGGDLQIQLRPANAHLEIEFTDTGCGILPENMDQIFEPYFSTKETGIGLGLPLTKKIIEEHGGQIGVLSQVGSGTTFALSLPRNAA